MLLISKLLERPGKGWERQWEGEGSEVGFWRAQVRQGMDRNGERLTTSEVMGTVGAN